MTIPEIKINLGKAITATVQKRTVTKTKLRTKMMTKLFHQTPHIVMAYIRQGTIRTARMTSIHSRQMMIVEIGKTSNTIIQMTQETIAPPYKKM